MKKSVLIYGHEITMAERSYGALDEFQSGLENLRAAGFEVVKDENANLTYVGCLVADAEENEECVFDMDNVMSCVRRESELNNAIEESLGHWVWLRIPASFHLFSVEV